jgi:hypothetical protein
MHKIKIFLQSVLTAALIMGVTTALYLYTSGYRLIKDAANTIDLTKTGMVGAKSIPDGANVYLDDKLRTATDDTVAGVSPGNHTLKITKKGFIPWQKDIEIYQELVTDITAVLISQSPRLEPLTNTGARLPSISHSLNRIAYFSDDETKPGVWVIPLGGGALNIFRSTPSVALEDTRFISYSQGRSIEWSPKEDELLIEGPAGGFYLVDLETSTAETTASPDLLKETWQKELTTKREAFLEELDIPEDLTEIATSKDAVWAPDEKKFLYTVQLGDRLQYKVYNMEDPLPIGEKVENLVFSTNVNDPQPKVSWYADSFHLVLVEGDVESEHRGRISLIRIDGTNKTEIYNNTLYSDVAFSAPGGDKIIILTSFRSADQTDLYTIGIR